jgi:hypothetical protein
MSAKQQQPKPKKRTGAGRPRKDVDLEALTQLCMLHVTDEEIAAFFGVGRRTVARWKERPDVGDAIEAGRAKGRTTLRRLQMQAAQKGNATMLIWLGKQHLDQRDVLLTEHSGPGGGPIEVVDGSASDVLMAALDRIAARKPDTEGGTEQ